MRKINNPAKASRNSTCVVITRNCTPITDRHARIMLNTNNTRRAGDSFFSIPANRAATILNGCFQAFCEPTARQSTSCLYSCEIAWVAALNCGHRSSASMPAVNWRQPSLERHRARLALVLRLCPKLRNFAHLDPVVGRSSSLTRVATVQPYALPRCRADQVFQVFLNVRCPVPGRRVLAAVRALVNSRLCGCVLFRVELSGTTKKIAQQDFGQTCRSLLISRLQGFRYWHQTCTLGSSSLVDT